MLRENPEQTGQDDMFRSRLASIIDMGHELARLAGLVEWDALARETSPASTARTTAGPGARSG